MIAGAAGPCVAVDSPRSIGLRAVALFEAAKGLVVLLAGSGLLLLVRRDVEAAAERLITHLHLDPASRYPRIFLEAARAASPGRLRLIALGALLYAVVRLVEAGGLWLDRKWAEWFGVVTAGIYLPFEVRALVRRPGPEPLLAIALNLAIVLFLALRLRRYQRSDLRPRR